MKELRQLANSSVGNELFTTLRDEQTLWVVLYQETFQHFPVPTKVFTTKFQAQEWARHQNETAPRTYSWVEPVTTSLPTHSAFPVDEFKSVCIYVSEGEYDDYLYEAQKGSAETHIHSSLRTVADRLGLRAWFDKLWPEYEPEIDEQELMYSAADMAVKEAKGG